MKCAICARNTDDRLCDVCIKKALEHRDGDHRCGRGWQCACVLCCLTRIVMGCATELDLADARLGNDARRGMVKP